ncbi:MAG: NAD(P)/FAD-dependent oxidoreductase [Candidatus Pacebacteria bacterium]|nr:NAD(P)/FAD-dependent oxidoreductase [Candidatus Paceibacterota bacterium]
MTTNKQKKEIKILGAGIAGLTAGIILGKSGYNVRIFEKRPNVGSYFEKDVHSIRNYRENYDVLKKYKSFGIILQHAQPIFEEYRFAPSSKNLRIYSKKRPLFYNFIRGYKDSRSLDMQLLKIAKKFGVKIFFNKKIKENDTFNIIATGTKEVTGMAFGRHYKLNSKVANNKTIYYFLNKKYAPGGYIYLSPFFDEFSLVIATTKILAKSNLQKKFNEFIKNNELVKKLLDQSVFQNEIFGFGFFDVPKTATSNNQLRVGEAAGFIDANTGFGVHYAIISGYLAAQSLIKHKNYDTLWKKEIGKELKEGLQKRIRREGNSLSAPTNQIEYLIKKYGPNISAETYKNETKG